MFKYELKTSKEVLTPFCNDFKQIKSKVISSSSECLHKLSVYPNGFILETLQYRNKVILITNKPLINNNDGTLSVLL